MKIRNVLSLFNGMSCGNIALDRAGVDFDTYYSSEVDKYANIVTQANYPNTVQLGDVTEWQDWGIDWSSIDLLIGGSPCQGFSFAGKQLAFDDPRSKLFFVYVDILNHIKSVNTNVKFMLENVKMKKEYLDIISNQLGADPVFINSDQCSPTARPRYYWANFNFRNPEKASINFSDTVGNDLVLMGEGWHRWWIKNGEWQIKKQYSKLCKGNDIGVCMTARQYASWNGNFILTSDGICKPDKKALSRLCGAPSNYLSSVSQRQSELLVGNGWTVDVIAHIFKGLKL